MVSSRVHPGETPASFVFNGFLDFILNDDDPRAKQLRRQFVFKMIPILNPDGVVRGHYRTDARGVNLNRMYLDPSFDLYPSIYASKSLLVYHHVHNKFKQQQPADGGDTPTRTRCYPVLKNGAQVGGSTNKALQNTRGGGRSQIVPGGRPSGPAGRTNNPAPRIGRPSPPAPAPRSKTYNMVHPDSSKVTRQPFASSPGVKSSQGSATSVQDLDDERQTSASVMAEGSKNVVEHLADSLEQFSLRDEDCAGYHRQSKLERLQSSNDIHSGGEFGDLDDDVEDDVDLGDTEHLGNEGSEDEGECNPPLTNGVYAPHLSDTHLLSIKPEESGIALYVDLHGHASKRGCFIYGNYFESEETQAENMLFPKLISLNTGHFDFTGCNFTERNMYLKDRKEGLSKEGAGRVAMYKALGIIRRLEDIYYPEIWVLSKSIASLTIVSTPCIVPFKLIVYAGKCCTTQVSLCVDVGDV